MRYTVVVKTITSSNGNFERKRYNNISSIIIRFLLKYHFSFIVGIAEHVVNRKTAENYIEVYTKSTFLLDGECEMNRILNEKLYNKLEHLEKRKVGQN